MKPCRCAHHQGLGVVTPGGAINAAGSLINAVGQGGQNPLADIQAVLAIAQLFGGKPSNFSAYAWFTGGPIPQPWNNPPQAKMCGGNVCGDEQGAQSSQMAHAITQALTEAIAIAVQHGIQFPNAPPFIVVIGTRDAPGLLKADHSGAWLKRSIAGIGDAQGAAMGAFTWLSQFAQPPLSSLASSSSTGAYPPANTIMQVTPPASSSYAQPNTIMQVTPPAPPANNPAVSSQDGSTMPTNPPAEAGMFPAGLGVPLAIGGGFVVLSLVVLALGSGSSGSRR